MENIQQYYQEALKWVSENTLILETSKILITFTICALAFFISRRLIHTWLNPLLKKFITNQYLELILAENPLNKAAHVIPGLILYNLGSKTIIPALLLQNIATLWIGLSFLRIIFNLIDGLLNVYNTFEISKDKPGKIFVQLLKMFLWAIALILGISLLLDQSPVYLISGLGALTAVLMLVFKDTISGIVASIQIQANDMIRLGDWIEMPKFNADGDVIDIALHTVKVQNWNKTITTVPIVKFIEESFINWRGMQQSGGRRICRTIMIEPASVKFLDEDLIKRLEKIALLKNYLDMKKADINQYNAEHDIDETCLINGRRMTNLGTFRAYILEYLNHHPGINKNMTKMVRQLQPTSQGIPMQLYCFTATTAWINYEAIQGDIFDHLIAAISEFDLKIFQEPSSYDIQSRLNRN